MSSPHLLQLLEIISSSVNDIVKISDQANIAYPTLDQPYIPTAPSELLAERPDVTQKAELAISACFQLMSNLTLPSAQMHLSAYGFHISSAMRVAMENNIPEILHNHPEGVHVDAIAEVCGLDVNKIVRILRVLATHHIFTEVTPGVFKNNRLSSVMDTNKPINDIKADPVNKHAGTSGFPAFLEHTSDEMLKASAYVTEALEQHKDSALPVVFQANNLFEWYEQPGNEKRLARFGSAMQGFTNIDRPDAMLKGFDWSSLPEGSLVVDVGGGTGHVTMKIFENHPKLKYVVQDRASVLDHTKSYWKNTPHKGALENGTVRIEAYNFFDPQPIKDASMFIMKHILHDHTDAQCIDILKNIRKGADSGTRLLVVEAVSAPVCVDDTVKDVKGYNPLSPPQPLLQNLGRAKAATYLLDMQMLAGLGGEERTIGGFRDILKKTGWKLVEVFPLAGTVKAQLLAVPV